MATGFKSGGRQKGVQNRTTAETKELLQTILGKELDKLGVLLGKLEPLERVNAIAKLLPYIVPKQVQQEITVAPTSEMTEEQREDRLKYLINKYNESK